MSDSYVPVDFHFVPTENAKKNLEKEGIYKNVWIVGNERDNIILVTGHRQVLEVFK